MSFSQLGNPNFANNVGQSFGEMDVRKNKNVPVEAVVSSSGLIGPPLVPVELADLASAVKSGLFIIPVGNTATTLVLPSVGALISQFNWEVPTAGNSLAKSYQLVVANLSAAAIPAASVRLGSVTGTAASGEAFTNATKKLVTLNFTLTNTAGVLSAALVITLISLLP